MAPKKKPITIRPNTLVFPEHHIDIKKTLAERLARQKQDQEFGCTPCSNDSILTLPTFSDSMMESSQEIMPLTDPRQNLYRLVTLDIFSGAKFCFFDEAQVKFTWLDPNSLHQLENINLDNPSSFILSEFKALDVQSLLGVKPALISRYLLLLMSVTSKRDVLDACTRMLQEHISSKHYNIPVPDFVAILMNYGAPLEKLWPCYTLALHYPFGMSDALSSSNQTPKLPILNLANLLSLFLYNLKVSPLQFTIQEKIGLFNLFLNLSMDKAIVKSRFILELVKSILARLLDSFTQEEWSKHNSTLVEELVLYALNSSMKLDTVGLVQRVGCIGNLSSRTAQTQQACAFFVIQECLGFSEITVAGTVSVDDILEVLGKVEKFPTDYEVAYCLVKALSYCIDITHPSIVKEKILELTRILNDWRHSIRDVSVDCDTNRLAVKDFITELTFQWKDPFAVDIVV